MTGLTDAQRLAAIRRICEESAGWYAAISLRTDHWLLGASECKRIYALTKPKPRKAKGKR